MKIGFAFCGSFCNHPELLKLYEDIAREHEIVPILSENAAKYSTRFGTAEDFVTRVEALAGRKAVRNIVEAEPLGEGPLDLGGRDRHGLEVSEHVGEPQPDKANVAFFQRAQHEFLLAIHVRSVGSSC